jgi:hypothetical protein
MGHYDSCYNYDRQKSIERHERETKERLLEKVEELSIEDRDFIMFVCNDIEDIKAHFRIIGKIKDGDFAF